jgi:hypothetical protein
MDDPPVFDRSTATTVAAFQGCFVPATANENVSYLPRANGAQFKSTAGPQNYVFWIVNIDDLGDQRRVTVHAINSGIGNRITPKVQGCLG